MESKDCDDKDSLARQARMTISDPVSCPTGTRVLKSGTRFLISANGLVQNNAGKKLTSVKGKVFTGPLSSPTDVPDPSATDGYIAPNGIDWYFYGSVTTPDPTHTGKLLNVVDPATDDKQQLYIWGKMSDGSLAEFDTIGMCLVLGTKTNAGDAVP